MVLWCLAGGYLCGMYNITLQVCEDNEVKIPKITCEEPDEKAVEEPEEKTVEEPEEKAVEEPEGKAIEEPAL